MDIRNIVLFVAILDAIYCFKLPDFIKVCRRSDPKLEDCALKYANEALPNVLKGDPTQKLPNLLPLIIPKVTLEPSDNLKLHLTDIKLYGLENTIVKKIKFDFVNRHCSIIVDISRLNVDGKYKADGRILILPIVGSGPANFTFVGSTYQYEFDYSLITRRGKEYLKFKKHNLEYTTKKSYFMLNNLFNGDENLSNQMNRFMEENWKVLQDELYPSLKKTIGLIVTSIASNYLSRISFDQLFLP